MSAPPVGLLLCDDLIFTSRVVGTAKQRGLTIQSVRDAVTLVRLATTTPPTCVIVDLHSPGLDLPALLRDLSAVCTPMPRVVGYGSHVDADALRAARQAGCDPVLPRSKFVDDLPMALPGWMGVVSGQADERDTCEEVQ